MSYQVIRKSSWGKERVVGEFATKAEAEADRDAWDTQTLKDFREGRITYDVPEFEVRHPRPERFVEVDFVAELIASCE